MATNQLPRTASPSVEGGQYPFINSHGGGGARTSSKFSALFGSNLPGILADVYYSLSKRKSENELRFFHKG